MYEEQAIDCLNFGPCSIEMGFSKVFSLTLLAAKKIAFLLYNSIGAELGLRSQLDWHRLLLDILPHEQAKALF